MNNSQITLTLIVILLIILISTFYFYKKKIKKRKLDEKLNESIHVTEKEKIRVYLDKINENTRRKHH